MPKNVKVSFIVAVHKVAEYIERCVRSIYEQTLEDIEIILVDDCTPDNSIEIAKRVLADYPHRASQMKVLRHEKNTGLKGVRKDGVKVAEGEYVIFVDGDDYLDVRMGEMMYSKAIEEEAEMVICGFWWYRKDGRFFRMPLGIDSLESTQKIKDATFDISKIEVESQNGGIYTDRDVIVRVEDNSEGSRIVRYQFDDGEWEKNNFITVTSNKSGTIKGRNG